MPVISLKQSIAFLSVAMLTAVGCHNNTTPQQSPGIPSTAKPAAPTVNYNNGPDSNAVVKPIVDKNAKDGVNTIYYKDGTTIKAKGTCYKGLKIGEWQSFHPNGKLWSDEYFTKGVPDGKVTVWYDNGQKFYEGEFKNGQKVNTWTFWKENGQVMRTADYNKEATNMAL